MPETFPIKNKGAKVSLEEDDLSLEFFITKLPPSAKKKTARGVKVTDVGEGANFLDVLIFAAAVCLWMNAVIQTVINVAAAIGFTDSYAAMLQHNSLLALIALQMSAIFIGYGAAICASLSVNYDVHAHDVTLVVESAIGLVACNLLISIAILVLSYIEHETMSQTHVINDSRCTGDCGKGMDIVTHLFVGCTYEGIAVSVSVLPVLVLVLLKAKKFVEKDHAKREQGAPKPSPDWKVRRSPHSSIRHQKPQKTTSSETMNSIAETVMPEMKPPKTLPGSENDSAVRNAVIKVMSEDLDDVSGDAEEPPKAKTKTRNVSVKLPSSGSSSSSSSPNPKSTSSASETDQSESAK